MSKTQRDTKYSSKGHSTSSAKRTSTATFFGQTEHQFFPTLSQSNQVVQRKAYEIATTAYSTTELEKTFSEQERQWINEVFTKPEIAKMLSKFGEIKPAVLHRVSQTGPGDTAQGESSQDQIAIADGATTATSEFSIGETKKAKQTPEEDFKETLIHEIFHFLQNQTEDIKERGKITPNALIQALIRPELEGMAKYTFGWFVHPDVNFVLHFDLDEIMYIGASYSILGHPDLMEIRKTKGTADQVYESSPMPKSGHNIGPEEDLAKTMGLYLTSANSRKHLQIKFPLRFQLMELYFNEYILK